MASGDLAYCDPRDFFICVPWEPSPCYIATTNGFEYYYEDGQGGYYCGSGSYCESGYRFFNQNNLGYSDFSDSTGNYCCVAISNGCGGYYWSNIYLSGTIFESSGYYVNIESQCFPNGFLYLKSDGTGSCFYDSQYCGLGFTFFKPDEFIEYVSDGTGYYRLIESLVRNAYDLCINWDFSKRTKLKYNFCQIDACGSDILLSVVNLDSCFYEINSICETSICLFEANKNYPIYIEDVASPFVFIRNVGANNLNIKLSDTLDDINFKDSQICNKNNYINKNIILKEKESIIFSLNVQNDGALYYSTICYPFGFFYEFKNVDSINEFGFYPVCCIYNSLENKFYPSYLYSDVCGLSICSGNVVDTGYAYCYQKQLSFYEKLKVDKNSLVEITFSKQTGSGEYEIFDINKNFTINSCFGYNLFSSCFCTNQITISDEIQNTLIDSECYSKIIDDNSFINIIYDVDLEVNKCYKLIYLDCASGSTCYDLNIIKINALNECFVYDKNLIYDCNGVIELKNNEITYAKITTDEFSVIRDLRNKCIDRCNLFLPTCAEFNYDYCFELLKTNYLPSKSLTGFWISCIENFQIDSGFCNYSMIIDCNSSENQQYKSQIYNISLCNQEGRKSTCTIQDKSLFTSSDDFFIPRSVLECCFYYSGLEFRYSPVECVLYKGNYYQIPNENIQIEFNVSGNSELIDFPINAINYEKLKINTDFEIFDSVEYSKIYINYLDFNFNKVLEGSNFICYSIPVVQSTGLGSYEYPQVLIENKIKQNKQTNIKFDINPINCFNCDPFYGLNNFLIFITSKLNSGLAFEFLCCNLNLCDYCYNSTDYNFLMMDVNSEYSCCSFTVPTVCWNNIIQKISFDENSIDLISYKNYTGNGYNYILPVVNCFCFSDEFSGCYSGICNQIIHSGLLNYVASGLNYDGSSRSIIYLVDESQNITGCYLNIDSGSYFLLNKNCYSISLQSLDLLCSSGCRTININKNYEYTGIQPFFINSNYAMLDIKSPMLCTNLQPYSNCINEDSLSGLYYYTYSINNPKNIPLKLVSPEFTYITNINWGYNNIDPFSNVPATGLIQNNSARINLDIEKLIYENPYILNCCCIQNININMIGGL